MNRDVAEFVFCLTHEISECLLNPGKVPAVIGKKDLAVDVHENDFDCRGSDIYAKCIIHF